MFDKVLGQPKAVTFFQRALTGGRLSHAYLLHGPHGVGKKLLAEQVAANLFCRHDPVSSPCGACPGCHKYASGNHPDFLRVQPEGPSIKISRVRDLKQELTFAPFAGGYRVILVEDVHTMRREAGNSLLKILEEPPAQTLFLLLSVSLETVLPTILSRCQLIPCTSLPLELAARIVQRERPDLSAEEAFILAQLADGCPGQALTLNSGKIYPLYVQSMEILLGDERRAEERILSGLALAAQWDGLQDELPLFLHLLRFFFKETLVPPVVEFPGEARRQWLDKARERWNFQQISGNLKQIDYAEQAIKRNCNRGLTCEVLALHLLT
ncbi:MAG: DNA polymerase III subunit delta' [Desulfobulbus propionicus]|nr:MAG: DNA polymerase III subunit delta' [Desulfobulbus propionicus]